MPIALAERLRTATQDLHTEVERSGLMRDLLRGRVQRAGYCRLLRNLHTLYAALEAGLHRHAGHAALAPVTDPALARASSLAHDLDTLHGADWHSALPLVPAAVDYADRLRTLARTAPHLLAAHAYVRYLGDLSGGQVLARLIVERLGLPPGTGVSFYDFGSPAITARLKDEFRRGLDRLVDDEDQAIALVDEARAAFVRHKALFEQLGESGTVGA